MADIKCPECGNMESHTEQTCNYCGADMRQEGYICYVPKNFRSATLDLIETADSIISEYSAQGYSLSLRQLYYQFVSRGLIPNSDREYKKLGSTVNDARLAGLISWTAIEDRNREAVMPYIQESHKAIIESIRYHFGVDMWKDQPRRVEVWVEKDALSSIVQRACRPFDAPYMACKGYLSASEMWQSAQRAKRAFEKFGQTTLVIHLGDHDPSGIDMTRDNLDRLDLLTDNEGIVNVKRIALNRDQVDRYDPPPNPAKVTDSRAEDYIQQHGTTSWELDALEPRVIEDLIKATILNEIDPDPWDEARERQTEGEKILNALADNWDEVRSFLEEKDM